MSDAPPTSAAEGAKYHAIRVTKKWRAFREASVHAAKRTEDARERWDRERHEREAYVRAEKPA